MDRKDLEIFFSVVHPVCTALALSAMSSRDKPELAHAKRFDPSPVG